jgi:trehalose-6-phosphatase
MRRRRRQGRRRATRCPVDQPGPWPDADILALLAGLAARPGTETHVVSGRRRETLERWLGPLAVGLHAEHGLGSGDRHGPRMA